ncbi:MAG: helix-turn-helix domain-containing protein [Xenococcaceae cyanobacterium]
MSQSASYLKNQQSLQQLMQQVQIPNLEKFSQSAGISQLQLFRLQNGLIEKMSLETLIKIATTLQISLDRLVNTFSDELSLPENASSQPTNNETTNKLTTLQQEYQRLQVQLEEQRIALSEEFQRSSLHILESWLLQWPTAEAAVQRNPQLPAERLLKLVQPVENLIAQWQVETICTVGAEIPFDPQLHELMEGNVQPGELVKVRYVGYRQGDSLLYRAKVSPIAETESETTEANFN